MTSPGRSPCSWSGTFPGFATAKKQFERDLSENNPQARPTPSRSPGPLESARGGGSDPDRVRRPGSDSDGQWQDGAIGPRRLVGYAASPADRDGLAHYAPAPGIDELRVDTVDDEYVLTYLKRRNVPAATHQPIVDRAKGNWLIAKLLADQALTSLDLDRHCSQPTVPDLHPITATAPGQTRRSGGADQFRPLLAVFAATGVGPILPSDCCAPPVCGWAGRTVSFGCRDRLVDLRGLVVRERPGTADEHVGLFHRTLGEWLFDPANGDFGIDPQGHTTRWPRSSTN